jgi:hypothetical protein
MSALIFQRLARNFIKNGYFPTDSDTTARILDALEPASHGNMRILDPCCGEGVALAEVKAYLGHERTEAFGVEYDAERAWHSKRLLDRCLHSDFQQAVVGKRQFGLLWLNPPYGDLVTDKSGAPSEKTGRKRLEKLFYQLSHPTLAYGGVLILIVPQYALDHEFCTKLATYFEHLRVYRAPEQRFKQVVVFGVRKRAADSTANPEIREQLEAAIALGEQLEILPEVWTLEPYRVPATASPELTFHSAIVDAPQLADEITRLPSLWSQFTLHFGRYARAHRPPVRQLSRWHLALALAAGQVSGAVQSKDGRTYVVKGATHKEKSVKVTVEEHEDGDTSEVRTLTDFFVPVIRAIDMTPGSNSYGDVIEIR